MLNPSEIVLIKKAGEIAGKTLAYAKTLISPGISTYDLDKKLEMFIIENGGVASCKGYMGFPCATCISVNEVVVHGIPSKNIILKEGDIVSVDLVVAYKGYHADAARTFPVGKISSEKEKLIKVTRECFFQGLRNLHVGQRLGNLSHAIQEHAEKNGYGVVRELCGHGIGKEMHENPSVLNYGREQSGPIVEEGMILAIEPMITMGKRNIFVLNDGWGVVSRDRKPAAQYENTVIVTQLGAIIITNGDEINANS
ncbi:MAG: type I methionyl aminopeptidase [Clostridia bacterium]|nr:type I methionyl aminopeptidase [Clostridia bacterium]